VSSKRLVIVVECKISRLLCCEIQLKKATLRTKQILDCIPVLLDLETYKQHAVSGSSTFVILLISQQ